jgi:hypothetical protein
MDCEHGARDISDQGRPVTVKKFGQPPKNNLIVSIRLMKYRGFSGRHSSAFALALGLCFALWNSTATLAQEALSRHTPEGVLLEWNLPEALGISATQLERIEPPVPTGGRVAGIWANERWLLSASAAAGALSVFQFTGPGTVGPAGALALDPVAFGELAQAVIKQDDAILISRSGQVLVYRLRTGADGGPVQVGQLVGPLPAPEFRLTGIGRRSGPGPSVDYLYMPAGADGVALYDLTLEWFPRAVRNLRETRVFGPNGLEAGEPLAPPTAVAALTDLLAVASGGREIRLVEEFFFSQWETIDRGRWQAGQDETVTHIYGQVGRLYAVVQAPGGQRLQVLALIGKQLTARGSLALPPGTQVTALEPFGPSFLAATTGTGGTMAINIADENQPALVASLAALDAAEANALATQFPHLWVNDRPSDASHLVLANGDSALARYAAEGELPGGMTLSPAGVLRWTPGEDRGGTQVSVPFTRTLPGATEHRIAEVMVDEANQAPVISPVAEQQLVAGRPWSLNVTVTDADLPAQPLSLITDRPEIVVGARSADGTFPLTWTPLAEAADATVTLIVQDDAGGSATNRFPLAVASSLHRLEWSEHAAPAPATNWPAILVPPQDGRHAVFSVVEGQLPSGVALDANGLFSGIPDEPAGGTTNTFRVTAVLAGETNHLFYTVTVAEVDDLPVITPIPDQNYAYGLELVIPLVANDPDQQAVGFIWSANAVSGSVGIPDLGALPIGNGQIRWTPDPGGPRLGSYWVTVAAVERHAAGVEGQPETTGLTNQVTFLLSPTLENLAPYWGDPQPLIQLQATEGQPVHFPRLRVFDPNGSVGRLESYGTLGPAGVPAFPFAAQADGGVQIPDWTPREDAGGRTWQFTVMANDLFDATLKATNVITVEVGERNGPPVWRPVPAQQGVVGQELALDLSRFVSDADQIWVGDALLPDPLTFQVIPGNPIPGNPTVTPDGHLTWTPEAFAGCAGQLLVVEARDSVGNVALGRILLGVQPLIPLSSTITNRIDGEAPNLVNHLVANAVLGWDLGHDLNWLTGFITNTPGTCFAQANCFLKAYRSLSWPGARPDARVRQDRLNGDPRFPLANVESRGVARLTNLVALPRTAALLGDNQGELWLRFGEYYLGRGLNAGETDVQGVDWGYVAATTNEWRIYHAKTARNLGPVQRAEIWYYDGAGHGFRLTQTVEAQPPLHLSVAYNVLSDPNDDTITARTEEGQMEESFSNPDLVANDGFVRGLAAVLAAELAGRRLSFRMDQLTAVDTDVLAQAAIQCALLDPNQQICAQLAPMGLYTANGAILISGCDDLSANNRPPDLQPVGIIPAAPGDVLSVQLRATDPDVPQQALTFSLDAESVRRGLRVDPFTGLLTWNVPADAGCIEVSGTATVQDPEPLSDAEPFTIRISPRRFSVPFSGVFEKPTVDGITSENEGLLATESAGGHWLEWLPVAEGALPPVAARRWSSPDLFPNQVAVAHPQGPVPFRGAHFILNDRNLLPRTQRVLRELGRAADALGLRFDLRLVEDRKGLDWGYDPITAQEWRHYAGDLEITLDSTTLFRLSGQTLSARLEYDFGAAPVTNRLSATSGQLVLPQPEPHLDAAAAAVAAALGEDLNDGFARLNFPAMPVASAFNLIEKGFPVVWHDLAGALEVFSCEPPYVAPYLLNPGSVTVDEGNEAFVEFRVLPANAANLQFRLIAPPDPRMQVTDDGKFRWPTDENDGGRSVTVNVEMTDVATVMEASFVVTVRERNTAPVLAEIPAQTVSPGNLLRVRLNALDSDRPRQRLTFSLDAESVRRGFQVDPINGQVTWRPGPFVQSGFTTVVEARVSDGLLDAARTFRVTVLPNLVAVIGMRALDGYLAGASVWWDADLDGQPDAGEPQTTTDRSGNFEFQLDLATWDRNGDGRLGPTDGRLVATGGLDLMTGLPFIGRLTAPADAAVISPLTALLERLTRDGSLTEAAAQDRVRDLFGLPDGLDLAAFDPLPSAEQSSPAGLRIQAANIIIADTVRQLAALLEGRRPDLSSGQADETVFQSWTASMRQPLAGAPGAADWVRGMLDHAATALGVSVPEPLTELVGDVIGAQNDAKRAATSDRDPLERLARLQAGSLVDTAPALRALGSDVLVNDEFRVGQSGWFAQSLASLGSGDPLGTASAPGLFALSRTNLVVRENGSPDHVLAVVRSGGAAGPATLELSLLDSANLLRTNRLTLEFRDGERFRAIDWASLLANDTATNPGRTVMVTLTGATSIPEGATLHGDLRATATILDDDSVGSLAFVTATHLHDPGSPSTLRLVRIGGVSGRLVAQIDFAAADGELGTNLPPPGLIEFPNGVSQRLVLLPNLPAPGGIPPTLILKLSLAADSAAGGTLGFPAEVRVDYAAERSGAKIVRLEAVGNGTGQISLTGPIGLRHRIESSGNLRTWFPLFNTGEIVTKGETAVSTEVPIGTASEFFRVRRVDGE